jgi:hypothetical protein
MTTNRPDEDNDNSKTTGPYGNNDSSTNTFFLSGEGIIIIVCSVSAIVFLIAALVCYKIAERWRKSRNRHRQLNESEICDLYQNSRTIRDRQGNDYLETVVNRPLPIPPEMNRQSEGKPAVPEDDYLRPIPVDSHWLRHLQEIRQLPPAPPVFPRHLERLPLDGEGAYIPVIRDDEAPLLSPGPMHDITHDQQSVELSEESGYMVPNSPTQTSLQQNVPETDHSTGQRRRKHNGNEYQITAMAVVTPQGAEQQCSNTSKRRSVSESAAVSSDKQNETEESKDTKGKIYRSTCQLYLSPPTQHRRLPVSTSKPTVVVCIHTDL